MHLAAHHQSGRRVAVWRVAWLPPSETFIANHLEHLRGFSPTRIGIFRVPSQLVDGSEILLAQSTVQRVVFSVFRRSHRLNVALMSRGIDIVHSHFLYDATLIEPTVRRLGIPLVVTAHGYDAFVAPRRGIRGMVGRARRRALFRTSARIVAVSEAVKTQLLGIGAPAEKVVVLRNGVSPSPSSDPVRRGIVFVGRLVEKKGLTYLLQAMGRSGEQQPSEAHLDVYGDGPHRRGLEELARDLEVDVTFHGAQPPAVVRARIASAQVVAVPSVTASNGDSEGLPTVIAEALMSGTPVVGTLHSGIPEGVIHGQTGFLVPERNSQALRAAVDAITGDEALAAKLQSGALTYGLENFAIESQTAALERLYDEVVLESGKPRGRGSAS